MILIMMMIRYDTNDDDEHSVSPLNALISTHINDYTHVMT